MKKSHYKRFLFNLKNGNESHVTLYSQRTWCMLVYQVHGNVVHAGIQRMKSIIVYVIISKGSIFMKHISTVNLPLNRSGKLKKVVCVFVHC